MYTFIEIILSLGVLGTLVTILLACVCGCKNQNQKSELVGTAGVVKIHVDEEARSPTPTTPASIKRASTQNSQRSLPEIPHPVGRHDSGDTASEIYATVNLGEGSKASATASSSREHPYEHAYAKLQNENTNIEASTDHSSEVTIQIDERVATPNDAESAPISASVAISGQLPSSQELPYITPPAHVSPPRSPAPARTNDNANHFSGDSTDSAKGYTSISVREPLSNIRAQGINQQPLGLHRLQTHYATVSDDSDEMYAAIEEASMGEGSDTYAQIDTRLRRSPGSPDGDQRQTAVTHEVAVHVRRSAPPEIGASTSNATHSRQASMSSCSNSAGALGSPKPEKRQANSPLPPPPQVMQQNDTKHHRINSAGDLHFNHDKLRRSLNEKHQRNNSCVSSSDFYGCNYPVDKHRFSSSDLMRPLVAKELNFDIDQKDNTTDNLYNSIDGPTFSDYSSADANTSINSEQRVTESPSRNVEEMYAKVIKKSKSKEENKKVKDEADKNTLKYRGDDPGYETIDRKQTANHGYETIARKDRKNSQNQDPGYETVKDMGKTDQIYNSNMLKVNHSADSGPNSIVSSDPGYEHIAKCADQNVSDSDPNYEVLRNQPPTPPYATIASNYKAAPTYSTINKRTGKYSKIANNNDEMGEPNYESMGNEPLYTTGSESDPNYESVRPKESNYERVQQDPNYESLRCKDFRYESVRSQKDPNYESVKYFELSNRDPPYERVENDRGDDSAVERSDSSAGYEKINIMNNKETKNSINNGADGTVSDYFQV
ncbi:uncharacterized protein LOC126965773 isoform X2 [Leptidea sinapis]|uniref:uncharacterized protein LOC126965773 isoform X2 n=1 Tax=Leptidea sinapis TaxID=189913 RepID=UPI0021C32DF7|nr:uncharacterized protein LOC126965773 isoform X2 [Leptidea sinapis]